MKLSDSEIKQEIEHSALEWGLQPSAGATLGKPKNLDRKFCDMAAAHAIESSKPKESLNELLAERYDGLKSQFLPRSKEDAIRKVLAKELDEAADLEFVDVKDSLEMPPFPPFQRHFDRVLGKSAYIRKRAYQHFQREDLNPFFRFTAREETAEEHFLRNWCSDDDPALQEWAT